MAKIDVDEMMPATAKGLGVSNMGFGGLSDVGVNKPPGERGKPHVKIIACAIDTVK